MKNKVTVVIVVVLLVVVLIALAVRSSAPKDAVDAQQVVAMDTPVNVSLDFLELWMKDLRSTSTNPYQSGLAKSDILSKQLRENLASSENRPADQVDPVSCQTTVPEKIVAKTLYELDDKAQILVFPRDASLPGRTVITLNKLNEGWYIDNIECSLGEVAPEREFSFEKEGFILKNVPEPLDSKYWHLVFENEGVMGHTVPLFFDTESNCSENDAEAEVCNVDKFIEASKVYIKGQMTESGVEVKQLNFIK